MKTRSSGPVASVPVSDTSSEASDLGALDHDILSGRTNVKTMDQYRARRRSDGTLDGTKEWSTSRRRSVINGRVDKYIERHFSRARKYGKQIREARFALLAVQKMYGLKIFRDWNSKTAEQRADILRKANPDIPSRHAPDLVLYNARLRGKRLEGRKVRDCFLMPYVSLEDLQMGSNLPVFARSRAFVEPYQFALLDHFYLKWAQENLINGPIKVDDHIIWLGEDSKTKEYGQMFSLLDDVHAHEWRSWGIGLDPEAGILLLEAQKKTYSFLVSCCDSLLTPKEMQEYRKLGREYIERDSKPQSSEVLQETPWELPSDVKKEEDTEDSYLEPHDSLEFIYGFLTCMQKDAEKHWNDLREDPAYLATAISRQRFGNISREDRKPNTRLIDATALESAVKEIYCTGLRWGLLWRWLEELAEELRDEVRERVRLERELGDLDAEKNALGLETNIEAKLRAELEAELEAELHAKLEEKLAADEKVGYRVLQLQAWLIKFSDTHAQSLLSSTYDMDQPVREPYSAETDAREMEKRDITIFERLRTTLEPSSPHRTIVGPTRIAREFKWCLKHKGIRKHVSTSFATAVNDMTNVCELLEALYTAPEWCAYQDHDLQKYFQEVEEDFSKLAEFEAKVKNLNIHDLVKKCLPLEERLDYPITITGTADGVGKRRSAENLLDELMLPLEELIASFDTSDTSKTKFVRYFQNLWQSFSPQRTPEWAGAPANTDEAGAGADEMEADEAKEPTPLKILGASRNRTQGRQKPITSASMVKQSLRSNVQDQNTPSGAINLQRFQLPKKFKCSRKAYQVFQVLFDKETDNSQGSLEMSDFVSAMANIGFKVEQGKKGSAVKFTYEAASGQVYGQTTFNEHSPHGNLPKQFDKRIVRYLATRFRNRYEWSMDTFELDETKS